MEVEQSFEFSKCFSCNFKSIWFKNLFNSIESQKKQFAFKNPRIFPHRNIAIIFYFSQFICCVIRLGVYSIRKYVLSIIINLLYFLLSLIAFYGACKLNPLLTIFHFGLMIFIYIIFLILMIITVINMSGNEEGEVFVYYIPLMVDIIPWIGVIYFNWMICRFQIDFEKEQKLLISNDVSFDKNQQENKNEGNNKLLMQQNPKIEQQNKDIEISVNNENDFCCICFTERKSCIFYSCGHVCCCFDCGEKLFKKQAKLCPICRATIIDIMKIYKA